MEITIHRCTLRVVRHGGWSWGPELRSVVQAATRVLPMLLARRLETLFAENADGEISAPVVLQLPTKLVDLAEVAAEVRLAGLENALLEQEKTATLDGLLERAVAVLSAQLRAVRFTPGAKAEVPDAPESPVEISPNGDQPSLVRVLLNWRARGSLPALLRAFSVPALEAWDRGLRLLSLDAHPSSEPAQSQLDALLATIVRALDGTPAEQLLQEDSAPSLLRAARLRRRLIAAVEIAARFQSSPASHAVQAAIDRVLPLPEETPIQEVALSPPDVKVAARRQHKAPSPPPHAVAAALPPSERSAEVRECAALPFLLLGPLSQIGVLDVLGAAFDAAQRSHELPIFAAGLALKVLPPPERGWRHRPDQLATAAAFAGLPNFPVELPGLADQLLDDVLSPIESAIARAVIEAHTPGKPLVAQRVDGGVLIADSEGLFPIACCATETLPRVIAGLTDQVFIPSDSADPKLLASLDRAGLRFVTDAPPTRGESFRRLAGAPSDHFWTNDADAPDAELCTLARPLPNFADELAETWRSLTTERACAPRPRHAALDRTLALLAGVALAFIAWALWRTRETAHPRLTLLRFRDFDARVDFRDRAVEVKLPLGRRHQDLRTHRLLDDVAAVPWLAGRALWFAGA
jgi:hypothetical protein